MAVLYYRELRLPEGDSVGMDDSIHNKCAHLFKRILSDFQTFGMYNSYINFIFMGEENGVYFSKVKLKVRDEKFSSIGSDFSCYHKEDLHSHIKSYIDSLKSCIVIFVTDKDKEDEFTSIIHDVKKSLRIKRKAEIIL